MIRTNNSGDYSINGKIITIDEVKEIVEKYCQENDKVIMDKSIIKDYSEKKQKVKDAYDIFDEELEELSDLLYKNQNGIKIHTKEMDDNDEREIE